MLGEISLAETHTGDAIRLIETFRTVEKMPESRRWRQKRRDLSRVTTIIVHQTAVVGGFGVGKRKLAAVPGDPSPEDRELLARMGRFDDLPYHAIYSPQDRASIVQWPAWARTSHGHGSNRMSVGWAYDGGIPGEDLDVDGARAALEHAIGCVREQGAPLTLVGAHRQHSKGRAKDPGVEIWSEVVVPVAKALGLVMSDHTSGTGLAIPENWAGSLTPPAGACSV